MGSSESKFKKHIEKNDETSALRMYEKNAEFRRKLNPNASVNSETLDTVMHLTAKYGMVNLLRFDTSKLIS